MRESKLLLLKNLNPQPPKKNNNLNMLSSLVEYSPKMKSAVINANNISLSPTKKKEKKQSQPAPKPQTTAQYK